MKRYLWLGLLAVLAAAGIYYVTRPGGQTNNAANETASVLVDTIKLAPASLPRIVSAYGSISPGPDAETSITLQASGIVASLNVVPGQSVAAGAVLANIAPDAQSVSDLQRATGALGLAKSNRAHVAALLASHLATNADLASADQAVRDAAGALAALRDAGAGRLRAVTAPFAGLVSAVLAAPGAALTPGAGLLRMINADGLVANVSVPPAQASAIQPGEAASITNLDNNATMTGTVVLVGLMADPQTGLTNIGLALANPGGAAMGAPVQATIVTGTLNGYVVPRDAVQNDEQGNYIFQVDAKNIAHRVNVQVLGNNGDQTVIATAGIDPGQPMVTTGAYQLDDGVAVRMNDATHAGTAPASATPAGAAN